jgi:hypothetical protein
MSSLIYAGSVSAYEEAAAQSLWVSGDLRPISDSEVQRLKYDLRGFFQILVFKPGLTYS